MIALAAADARYPHGLRDLRTPPDPLWVEGDAGVLAERCVAVVGTRRMSGYGERVAHEIAAACGASGLVVVSGLAQGIDSAAHRGALDGGGRTIAVLGESIPALLGTLRGRRRPLVPRIRERGAIVSEFAAPFAARPWTFAKRDATIAAIACAVVVVEAGETSGALITAEHARRLTRPLYAVPGPIGSAASVGTNRLIARGQARALTRVDELVADAWPPRDVSAHDALLDALRDGPLALDELSRRLRMPLNAVTGLVAAKVLGGQVAPLPDGRLRRV